MPTIRRRRQTRSSLSGPRIRNHEFLSGDEANPETRIGERIKPQPNGCWLFNGDGGEYGYVCVRGQRMPAHRYVYALLVGPIPEGHHIHHECETRGCVNPAHLIALTPKEHGQRHAELRRSA